MLRAMGAEAVIVDVFDADAVHAAMTAARPDVVVHQLTALPKNASPSALRKSMALTTRLRVETVPIFAKAARAAGARRCVVQSISFVTRPDGEPDLDETAALWLDGPAELRGVVEAVATLEKATLGEAGLEGIVLRYGFFYGPGTWYAPDGTIGRMVKRRLYPFIGDGQGRSSFIHIDDAVEATVQALIKGEPGIYNVTDDQPATQNEWLTELSRLVGVEPPWRVPTWLGRLAAGPTAVHYATTLRGASSAKARRELAWEPRPWRDGFREVFGASPREDQLPGRQPPPSA